MGVTWLPITSYSLLVHGKKHICTIILFGSSFIFAGVDVIMTRT